MLLTAFRPLSVMTYENLSERVAYYHDNRSDQKRREGTEEFRFLSGPVEPDKKRNHNCLQAVRHERYKHRGLVEQVISDEGSDSADGKCAERVK